MKGTKICDRYEILELLGEGGMARVYRARDCHLGREVAIKVLLESVAADPDLLERFRREARAAAALAHPNIVQVYDFHDTDEGAFLILELIRGEDLRTRLKRTGALPVDEAARIAGAVLAALEHAHARGLVHRDLSARNVLLDASGGVRVSDFGIARATGDRTLTRTGELVGSVQYISPEQARGEEAGPRADLYSAGVLLYEMLTGTLPFSADSPVQIALKHINEEPPPPSSRHRGLSPALDALVLRAMDKLPEGRFASAREMAEAVARAADGSAPLEPTLVRAEAPARPPERPVRKPRPPAEAPPPPAGPRSKAWLLAVVALVALAGAFAWTVFQGEQVKVPDLSGQNFQEAQRQVEALGLELRIRDQQPSPDAAPGTVLEQDPAGGSTARRGTRIYVVVSRGPETVLVPDLSGLTLSRAREELDRLGLAARLSEEESRQVPVGVVIRQDPAAGVPITRGTPVQVVVSTGTGKQAVPELVGMPREQAERILSDLGMVLEIGGSRSNAASPEETVLEQRPSAGTLVTRGQRIQVVLSRGRQGMSAPDLVGKSFREAGEIARGMGLQLSVEGNPAAEDAVTWQSPAAGEPVEGEAIAVRADRSAVVPGVLGLTVEQAAAALEAAGLRLGEVLRAPTAGAAPREVVTQDPKQGIEVPEGSVVDVYVADPSAPTPVEPSETPPAPAPTPTASWVP